MSVVTHDISVSVNDVVVNSVYAALTKNGKPEAQIPPNTPFFLVVNVQAGDAAWNNRIHFRLHLLLQDITASTNPLNQVIRGRLQDTDKWPTQNFTFNVSVPSGPSDSIYRLKTILTSDYTQTELHAVESHMFIIAD